MSATASSTTTSFPPVLSTRPTTGLYLNTDLHLTSGPGRFILYARKSTEGEDRQVQSIDDQVRLARACGLPVTREITEARSAKRHGARPGFSALLALIEAGEADGIVAWHPDRLARNAIDGGWILDLLDRGKLRHLRFLTYTFENTPEGKMMLGMIFSQAKYQVDKLSVDVRRGMDTKRAQGWYPHRVGEGYRNDRETRTVVTDPLRFPLLRHAVELILAGTHRPSEVLRLLNEQWGYRTRPTKRQGGGPLSRAAFYRLLSSPFYYGECREGARVYPGAHPPLLSREESRRVRAALTGAGQPRPQVHAFPLTGLIRCSRCGAAVTASCVKGHVYYHCTNRRGICTKRGTRGEDMEAQVLAHFDGLSIPAFLEPLLLEMVERHLAIVPAREAQARESAAQALEAVRKEMRALRTMRLRELLTDAEFLEEKSRLQAEADRLGRETTGAQADTERHRKTAANVLEYAAWAKEVYRSAEPCVQRRLAGLLGTLTLADRTLSVEPHPYLALLRDHHGDLGAIKPEDVGSGGSKPPCGRGIVPAGPRGGVQTGRIGSGTAKTASWGETVSAGSPGGTAFKLLDGLAASLTMILHEKDEKFEGLHPKAPTLTGYNWRPGE